RAAGARPGSVAGLLAPAAGAGTSTGLFELADRRGAAAVAAAAPAVARVLGRATRRAVAAGAAAAVAGGALLGAAAPAGARAAAFWHPLRTFAAARAPLTLAVDRTVARRGDTVTVTITAPAASRAVLWTRRLGEAWQAAPLGLDSLGRAIRRLGPLSADLYLRPRSGAWASRRPPLWRVARSRPGIPGISADPTSRSRRAGTRVSFPRAPGSRPRGPRAWRSPGRRGAAAGRSCPWRRTGSGSAGLRPPRPAPGGSSSRPRT